MKKRILWIDILRIVGALSVVIMHVIGNTLNTFNLQGTPAIIYNVIAKLLYFSIPLFIMISGMMFLKKEKEISISKMWKNTIKILLAIIIFGGIYSTIELIFIHKTFKMSFIPNIINKVITNNTWAHMWYLYLIFGLYLITPFLKKITDNITKGQYIYLLALLYIFNFLIPEISSVLNINIGFYIPISSAYIFLFIYGNYINTYEITKKYKYLSYLLGILSFVLLIIITLNNSYSYLITYTSTLTLLITNSVIILFKNLKIKINNSFSQVISSIGICSFGIYIIHQFYINIIFKLFKLNIIINSPFTFLIIYTLIIFIMSYISTLLLKKIKIIDKYLL